MSLSDKKYQIRTLCRQDIASAMALVWRVFSEFEAPEYSDEGIAEFRDFLDNVPANAELSLWGCFNDGKILGVIAVRPPCHISLLFVDKEYHRQGIARSLLKSVLTDKSIMDGHSAMTVNSSPYAVEAYRHLGFIPTDTEQTVNGIRYVPMKYLLIKVRRLQQTEYSLLEEFLYHAIFLPSGTTPLPFEIIFNPDIYIYIENFGQSDDCGVIAERDGNIVGAAWTRIIPAFGHVDDETPELAISVLPEYRGQSIGTMLLTRLFELLRKRGYHQTSLSVQKENSAVRLYRRMGYEIIRENDEDYIMVKDLNNGSCRLFE